MSIPLPPIDLFYAAIAVSVVALVALVFAVVGWVSLSRVKRRYRKVFGDNDPQNVERTLANLRERVDHTTEQFDRFSARLDSLELKSGEVLNRIGMVRFNPFDDTGSDLSFSLAILNDDRDGVVLTSLWGRDEVRLYAKPVDEKASRYALSDEERQAIDLADGVRAASRSSRSRS